MNKVKDKITEIQEDFQVKFEIINGNKKSIHQMENPKLFLKQMFYQNFQRKNGQYFIQQKIS